MFANPRLAIICEPCGRRGSLNIARLLDKQGDAKLTDHMPTPANCDMVHAFSLYDRCKARYGPLSMRIAAKQAEKEPDAAPRP